MGQENYSKIEIKNIVDELLNVHQAKLKPEEVVYLTHLQEVLYHDLPVTFTERDQIVAMFDRMGEANY